jgi:cyclohexanecarboxylate-CoA ligase
MSHVRPTRWPALADLYRRQGVWRPETIWQAFVETAARQTDRTMVVEGGGRLTFDDVVARAGALEGGLWARGIRPGDAVVVQLPNWSETVVVLLALASLGAVAVPVLPIQRERELGFVLRQTAARVAFIPGRYRDCDHRALLAALRSTLPALERVIVVRDDPGPDADAFDTVTAAVIPSPFLEPDMVTLVMYTSGTTADPKGVLHSHRTLLAEAHSLAAVHGIGPDDTVLMPSPLTHVSGLMHAVLVPATLGSRAVLMPRWDAGEALRLIAAERVTYMVGAPTFLRDIAHHPDVSRTDVSSFRLFSCGGADVDPALVSDAAHRLGCVVKRVYGSTEFPTITTTGPGDPPARRVDSDGRPVGAAEIRVVDDAGADVGPGREGEVLARGPDCCLGYLDASLNADAFTADGWFRTGDLGTVDAAGFLRITGRKKDVIIRKGENISAREVEEVAATHPAVQEVAVVALPDPAAGEIACAVLRLRPGATAPSLHDLADHLLAHRLSKRKLPERVVVVTDFPRTASGKVAKRVLRDQLAGR